MMTKLLSKRVFHYIVVILLLVWVLLLIATRQQRTQHATALQDAVNFLQSESSSVSELPSPNQIENGQNDSALDYIIASSEGLLTDDAPDLPSSWQLKLHKPFDSNWRQQIDEVQTLEEVRSEAKNILTHHANVLNAIGSLLRYNPQADLIPLTNNSQLQERIQAASEGLSKTKAELIKVEPYSTADDLDELQAVISELQSSLKLFDQNRDKNAWYVAVQSTQDKIKANRHSFWITERDILLQRYVESTQTLNDFKNNL